jgi:hypothetical protein
VLNAGFSGAAVTMAGVEARAQPPASATSQAIVAYVRLIELEAGDVLEIAVTGPDGRTLASNVLPPLETNKAQWLAFAGAARPPAGWPHGAYKAALVVRRAGAVAIRRSWTATI